MGKRSIEVPTYECTYCGYEALQLNQITSQTDKVRYICGDCMIKAFDAGLKYEPVRKPKVSKPLQAGQTANKTASGKK